MEETEGESPRDLSLKKEWDMYAVEVDWGQIESKEDSFFTCRLFAPIKTRFNY
jgi:hypothetical protein